MTRIIAFAGVLLLLAGLVGCQIQQRLNGTYEGRRPLQVNPGTDPVVANQLETVRLQAKEDGTAVLSDAGMEVEGELEPGSDSVSFKPLRIAGVSVEVQRPDVVKRYTFELKPQKDGSWLYDGVNLKKVGS